MFVSQINLSPFFAVSDHQSARPTTSLDELDETGDQSSECSSTLTPDSNSKVGLIMVEMFIEIVDFLKQFFNE